MSPQGPLRREHDRFCCLRIGHGGCPEQDDLCQAIRPPAPGREPSAAVVRAARSSVRRTQCPVQMVEKSLCAWHHLSRRMPPSTVDENCIRGRHRRGPGYQRYTYMDDTGATHWERISGGTAPTPTERSAIVMQAHISCCNRSPFFLCKCFQAIRSTPHQTLRMRCMQHHITT